jgi:UDP-N-acetylglucosamine 1-carboxyvinyltransferase
MNTMIIEGDKNLSGEIKISGAKNSAVALVPAALLSDEGAVIENVPNISDIRALKDILTLLESNILETEGVIAIDTSNSINKQIPEEMAKKLRASYYFMGALLGKYKKVDIFFPGGCSIGERPINLHLKGFELLGAKIEERENHFHITAEQLIGNKIYLDIASVGATINIMFAAVKAKGETVIENAAKEPEIVNVATFLNNMGANIKGAGTNEIRIVGVDYLKRGYIEVIPDRIEAGTYIIAGALKGENLKISNIIPLHLESLIYKLKEMKIPIEVKEDYLIISQNKEMVSTNIKTQVFPGFPTDLQQPMTTLLSLANGESYVEETIYENRFQNVSYLNQMGAKVKIVEKTLQINGVDKLTGKEVYATDLRAGACLVLAGLVAKGTTKINNIEHVLRGYENIIEKLTKVGALIKMEEPNE